MANHSEVVSFIWGVADLIRDSFKRGRYQDVILPFTVLRRIDSVLAPTKQKVIDAYNKYKGKLDNLDPQLCKASGFAFYNTSKYTFKTLLDDAPHLAANLRAYVNGFSKNMADVIEKFDFPNTIALLDNAGLLFKVMQRFAEADLSPAALSNHEMGYVFEELIRKFNEALDENPGEHFTPREVIRLMATLLTEHDRQELQKGKVIRTVYDPCCGSGGMLTIAKDRILQINPEADVHLFGQEVNPATYAVSKSDLYIKSADGRDAENIAFGSVLSKDGHADRTFDYLLANPPYGKDWNLDSEFVRGEAARASNNRFAAGLPSISDGQLLFLQHMLARMHAPLAGVSRVSIIMNGSPLFTGDAGSGPSQIRRWILEEDYLEALIALPQQLFYNTGISTYVWVLSNNKPAARKGKVLLIDASEAWLPRRKSLGEKRRDIPDGVERTENYIPHVVELFQKFADATVTIPTGNPEDNKELRAKVFPTTTFGYRKVTVERPLRLNFQASPERLARVEEAKSFQNLAVSRKKDAGERAAEEAEGAKQQEAIRKLLKKLPEKLFKDRPDFLKSLDDAIKVAGLRVSAPVRRAIIDALSERDETAAICRDEDGNAEPDTDLRDTENVPLGEEVQAFFEREVKPHVPDAWVNEAVRDEKDGNIGVVGYEINFNRYFYRYQPPRALEAIKAEIRHGEVQVLRQLMGVTGGVCPPLDLAEGPHWKPYPGYQPANVNWISTLPEGWKTPKVKHLIRSPLAYGVLKPDKYEGDDAVPVVRILDVEEGKVARDQLERISPQQSSEFRRTLLQAGDVVVSVVGTIGRCFIVPHELSGANLSRALARVQLRSEARARFFVYYIQSAYFQSLAEMIPAGTAQKVLNLSDLGEFAVPLPSNLDEQDRIASFLDRETAKIDALIRDVRIPTDAPPRSLIGSHVALLQEYRMALISATVTGQIDVRGEVTL